MPIDLIFLIVLLFSFFVGYQRGIIHVAMNILMYLFGILLAFKLTPAMTTALEKGFDSTNPLMFVAGFLVNFALLMILVRLAASGLSTAFHVTHLDIINRILGAVAYSTFGVLVFSVLLWFADKGKMVGQEQIAKSRTFPALIQLPGHAKDVVIRFKPIFGDIWDTTMNWMDNLSTYNTGKSETTTVRDLETGKTTKPAEEIERAPADQRSPDKPRPQRAKPISDGSGIEND